MAGRRIIRAVAPVLALGLPFSLAACRQGSPAAPTAPPAAAAPAPPPTDPWTLSTTTWEGGYRGTYLGNGYLGQRLLQCGSGAQGSELLPAYVAGLYSRETLAAIPSPTAVQIACGTRVFGADPRHLRDYRQELRMQDGTLVTRATWDTGSGDAAVEIKTALLRDRKHVAVTRVRVENRGKAPVQITAPTPAFSDRFVPEPATAQPGEPALSAARAHEGPLVAIRTSLVNLGYNQDGAPTLGLTTATVPPGFTGEHARVTAVVTDREARDPAAEATKQVAGASDASLETHRQAWRKLWQADAVVDADVPTQAAIRSFRFYLLSSVREDMPYGVPPLGLSGEAFNGHVFWDMDTWVFPALLPQHPELARSLLEYRIRTLPGARENAKAEGLPGAAFAWESAATGRETMHGEFRQGRHVSADIALACWQYYLATGDRKWLAHAWPLLQSTADNWAARAKANGGGGYDIRDVMSPDELAGPVTNNAWTNFMARRNLEIAGEAARLLGRPAAPAWKRVAQGLALPRDPQSGRILQHAAYDGRKSKQADTLLLVHPGGLEMPKSQMAELFDYYAGRVIGQGPAMTDAVHAVVAARLGRGDEALRLYKASYEPFVRPPYLYFSEKRAKDNACFVTGAGGSLQSVLYGFGGLRLEDTPTPRATPALPPGWKSLRLTNVQWRGKRYDLQVAAGGQARWSPAGRPGK